MSFEDKLSVFSDCSNDLDIFSSQNLNTFQEDKIVSFYLGDDVKESECHVINNLLKYWRDPDTVMRNWVKKQENTQINRSGHGGEPGNLKYYKLPFSNSWVEEIVYDGLRLGRKVFKLIIIKKNELIGNRNGSFGSSELHGQSPGVTIWGVAESERLKITEMLENNEEDELFNTSLFIQVAGGGNHSVGITIDRELLSWGGNDCRQIIDTPDGNDFVMISAGLRFSVALRDDGTLITWGDNRSRQVTDTPRGSDFVQISAGSNTVGALKRDGTIVVWGKDHTATSGVMLYGEDHFRLLNEKPWRSNYKYISIGDKTAFAIKKNGYLVRWGMFDLPNGKFSQISGSIKGFAASIREDGTIKVWGYRWIEATRPDVFVPPKGNDFIQIAVSNKSIAALRRTGRIEVFGYDDDLGLSDAPSYDDFIQISGRYQHFTALRRNGTVISWGNDDFNQVSFIPIYIVI
uniref:Regulator of chromosome condensation protein n=1 Tax=Pithovirus LCPAC401 TaxID=2506595 RepID=A0A481ZBM0_9VIRU|nr:MAG: regulator of chromosome condensation protein [Pithovirus LCPAC401]